MEYSLLIIILIVYLIGSIPFGFILTKVSGLGDIRNIGSGNIGATNVLRTGNKKAASIVLIFDILKGYLPTFFIIFVLPMTNVTFLLSILSITRFWIRSPS